MLRTFIHSNAASCCSCSVGIRNSVLVRGLFLFALLWCASWCAPAAAQVPEHQQYNDNNNNGEPNASDDTLGSMTWETLETKLSEPAKHRIENGIYNLKSAQEISDLLRSKVNNDNNVGILVTLVYAEQCPSNVHHVRMLEELIAVQVIRDDLLIGKIHLSNFVQIQLEQQQKDEDQEKDLIIIESVPSIALFVHDSRGKIRMWTMWDYAQDLLQYKGDGTDLVGLFWHYYSRLVVANEQVVFSLSAGVQQQHQNQAERVISLKPKQFSTHAGAEKFVCQNMNHLYRFGKNPALHRGVGNNETKEWQNFLIDNHLIVRDDFVVFVQCQRDHMDGEPPNYQKLQDIFGRLYETMIHRPDVFYVTVKPSELSQEECEYDGMITVWKFASKLEDSCEITSQYVWSPSNPNNEKTDFNIETDMIYFHRSHARPTLLWFDRLVAAPIVLASQVQALFFVKTHPSLERSREYETVGRLIKAFGDHCKESRQKNQDMICALVPSTETRLLTSLGVDIWSPLDQQLLDYASHKRRNPHNSNHIPDPPEPVLPQLLLIDRRRGGIQLYRLEHPMEETIRQFLALFWSNQLKPEIKSSFSPDKNGNNKEPSIDANEFGVQKLTAYNWFDLSTSTSNIKHFLILFVSPTCGHCKRLLTMFNQLSHLLLGQAPGWSDLLDFYIADVSTDELTSDAFQVLWLPDLVYMSPTGERGSRISQYNDPQKLNLLGSVSHYSDVLEWLIRTLDFGSDEEEIWVNLLDQLQQQMR